eukprot:366082-Chlamydomonas_euryale.AAC.15
MAPSPSTNAYYECFCGRCSIALLDIAGLQPAKTYGVKNEGFFVYVSAGQSSTLRASRYAHFSAGWTGMATDSTGWLRVAPAFPWRPSCHQNPTAFELLRASKGCQTPSPSKPCQSQWRAIQLRASPLAEDDQKVEHTGIGAAAAAHIQLRPQLKRPDPQVCVALHATQYQSLVLSKQQDYCKKVPYVYPPKNSFAFLLMLGRACWQL